MTEETPPEVSVTKEAEVYWDALVEIYEALASHSINYNLDPAILQVKRILWKVGVRE